MQLPTFECAGRPIVHAILLVQIAVSMCNSQGHVVTAWADGHDSLCLPCMVSEPVLFHLLQLSFGHVACKPSWWIVDGLHPE